MNLPIRKLTIEQFRGFQHLALEGLGRVNLIVGKNNTGKSSVLEAIRILASDAAPAVLFELVRLREEDTGTWNETEDGPVGFPLLSLFHGFPAVFQSLSPILLEIVEGKSPLRLSVGTGYFSEEPRPHGSPRQLPRENGLSWDSILYPCAEIASNEKVRWLPLKRIQTRFLISPVFPCEYISAFTGKETAPLAALWDRVALSSGEQDVIEALRLVDDRIKGVSMIAGGSTGQRTAIVKRENEDRPVPLRSFGDGLNRLFGIVLALVNAKGGMVLIDEFENGMHYTIQTDIWRWIFHLAARLEVQVVATSHSWDTVEAFQRAANETGEEGALIRLTRHGDAIVPAVFNRDELAIATRDQIEVR